MRKESWYSISSSPSFKKNRPPRFIFALCTAGMILASIDSPMFSTRRGRPFTKHSFKVGSNCGVPRRDTLNIHTGSLEFCAFTQATPCNCGSIKSGHRVLRSTMEPFSVETGSAGSLQVCHSATSLSFVKADRGLAALDMGTGTPFLGVKSRGSHSSSNSLVRYCLVNGPI